MRSSFVVFISIVSVLLILLSGCDSGQERLQEKASIEGATIAQKQVEATHANFTYKSNQMESDLAARHRFYQALKGTFEGSLETEQGEFKVKITLVPSLHPYATSRIRQLEEIASDLNNLHFKAHIVQWNPANRLSAVGCRIENIRPDLVNGEINIASESCPNLYVLRLAEPESVASSTAAASRLSMDLAASIKDGKLDRVSDIRGEVHPTTNAAVYLFSVSRVMK